MKSDVKTDDSEKVKRSVSFSLEESDSEINKKKAWLHYLQLKKFCFRFPLRTGCLICSTFYLKFDVVALLYTNFPFSAKIWDIATETSIVVILDTYLIALQLFNIIIESLLVYGINFYVRCFILTWLWVTPFYIVCVIIAFIIAIKANITIVSIVISISFQTIYLVGRLLLLRFKGAATEITNVNKTK